MLRDYIIKNKNKKMMIFTETKDEAKQFSSQSYADFTPLHGDLEQRSRASIL
jgi:superfamily II DNA/RNA helicase